MYHGITFNDNKHTWDDWCLIPQKQLLFAPPAVKTNYIDIPGANGSLDMSEILTGYPLYENRSGSFSFYVMNNSAVVQPECNPKKIHRLAMDLMEYLHGRDMKAILDDDPLWYYKGRFSVESIESEDTFNTININYNVEPYKWSIFDSVDTNWLWDPFNFESDFIMKGLYSDIELTTSNKTINFNQILTGTAPITPVFYFRPKSGTSYNWYLTIEDLDNGDSKSYTLTYSPFAPDDIVWHGQRIQITARSGSSNGGYLDIKFRPGRL